MKKTFMVLLYLVSLISSTAIANENKQKAYQSQSIPFIIQQHTIIFPNSNGIRKLLDTFG